MKRFTVKHKIFGWQIGGDIRVNVQGDCKHYNEAMEYFAAYENTGLTPEQVQVLKATQQNLRTQQKQPNEPLTLDELRQMDGEPVWLHTFSTVQKKTNIAQWAILEAVNSAYAVFVLAGCNARLTKRFSNYGGTWLTYRFRPEQEESN